MITFTGYHGTKQNKCKNIISTNQFYPSKGIRHWLGDGIYFFEIKNEAIEFVARYGHESALIEAEITVEENKLFDLATNDSHRNIFFSEAIKVLENIQIFNIDIEKEGYIDGFVVNFIYNNFYQFHVVKGEFKFSIKDFDEYKKKYKVHITRFFKNQIQYAVREPSCIVHIKETEIT